MGADDPCGEDGREAGREHERLSHAAGCGCVACAAEGQPDAPRAEASGGGRASASYVGAGEGDGAGLIVGLRWDDPALTYAFPQRAEDYDTSPSAGLQYGSGEPVKGFAPFTERQIAAAEAAFAQFAAVSGLSFTRLSDEDAGDAVIRLAGSAAPATAWGYYPTFAAEGGDAWFAAGDRYYAQPSVGTYGFHTILHEIGHTVGLKHGHERSGLPFAEDSMEQSVMTYRSYVGDVPGSGYANELFGYAQTLMQADIAALQALYGANYEHNAGDTVYRWDEATGERFVDGVGAGAPAVNRVFETLWDGGGVDTFDLSNYDEGVAVDLSPGGATILSDRQRAHLNLAESGAEAIHASGNVYVARLHQGDPRGLIENAIGGDGADAISGNVADNRLHGRKGDDELAGGAGDDRLIGGGGADTLLGDAGADVLIGRRGADALFGGAGADVLRGAFGVDRLEGGADDDRLMGGRDADALFGGAGDDTLRGGLGADRLEGGVGDDILRGGAGADVFVFRPGDGADAIADFDAAEDRLDFTAFAEAPAISVGNAGLTVAVGDATAALLGVSLGLEDILFV
ncbi:MAG: M10 family metallopeptidase C-terminal domain-containing protein [Pseudomonadota bacterium]